MEIKLSLSETDAENLAKLLDAAVRAEGLSAAEAALPIFRRLRMAADEARKQETDAVRS
jgi:hypothetical protein